jgi:hypothetical protein
LTQRVELIGDFQKYPAWRWPHKYHLVPPVIFRGSMFLVGGWNLLLWG